MSEIDKMIKDADKRFKDDLNAISRWYYKRMILIGILAMVAFVAIAFIKAYLQVYC